ncbi:MAG: TraB/GumN family protein [Lysobacterales bacterium CG17_big_fil_post_rev_8_21_14_2_50_64_11]|nr:MAG: TraB/GumN family protein [Xanthomonadales bacterium CG17_big_fil_post_rev_8_21_14_2_50_64_11]PIX59337.1 MAG: TraB/GumN family protein [Xanthomonadales bacterium CG_4_10_14_3_um_filter_64_11]
MSSSGKPIMKDRLPCALCLVLGLGHAMAQDAAPPAAPEPATTRMATLVVSGKQPGPGLWRVSKDDHDLWILGTLSPLPKRMQWESGKVERLLARSQELLAQPAVTVNAKVGFFARLALIPTALRARNNPDGRPLRDQVSPSLYARWLALKQRYIGRSKSIEKRRPIMAAKALYEEALDDNTLSEKNRVWPVLVKAAKKRKLTITVPTVSIQIADAKATLKEFAKTALDDETCFATTLERLETDMDNMKARANAWAVGDVPALIALPHPDQRGACDDALLATAIAEKQGMADLREQVRTRWLQAADAALLKNESTVAVMAIESLLGDDGFLAALRERGYDVVAPE